MNNDANSFQLILASSSTYRKKLLTRLNVPFTTKSPNINESKLASETPQEYVKRLSIEKAQVIAKEHPSHYVIGSDQTAVFQHQIIGKPLNFENAKQQLKSFSNQTVIFLTGICIVKQAEDLCLYSESQTQAIFRKLSDEEIQNYLKLDQPYDCAGSFKVESLGITLFKQVISQDPTCLEGLPLIHLCQLFSKAGINILNQSTKI